MTALPATSRVPVGAVLVAGIGAQLVDDAVFLVLPPLGVLGPVLAILLTAGAARYVTRNLHGAAVARTGLALGLTSAGVGLLVGGLGFVTILLAGVTVLAGVAGAVAGRGLASRASDQ